MDECLASQEISLPLPLKMPELPNSNAPYTRGTSDEGCPLSPETLESPTTPRTDLLADIQTLEKRLKEIFGLLANLAQLREGTKTEQQYLSGRFEELQWEHIDSNKKYRELAHMVERMEDRLKMEDEKQNGIKDKVAEEVEVRVKEEMDKRKSEYLAEMEEKMKAMMIKAQSKREGRELQLHVRQQRITEEMTERRVAEVREAMLEAHKQRDEVKRRFQVTVVKLQKEQKKNAHLRQKIKELEMRCQHLEEENARLRLTDIVHQTNFTCEGQMLECFSCRKEYSTHDNDPEGCKFHPIPCMPYETWRNCIPREELPSDFTASRSSRFHFWACCNVLASRRPEGCCHGRHHQQWEMDIMMRQVLVEAEHSAFTEPLKVQ